MADADTQAARAEPEHSGPTHSPRTVALIGPYGSGKTTLFDALLAAAGTKIRRGGDGKTHVPTTGMRLGHCRFLGDSWSLLDTPGSVEFAHDAEAALAGADIAVLVADADPGRAVGLRPWFRMIEAADLPFLVFVNRIDTLAAAPRDLLAALQAESHRPLILRQVPIAEGERITGYVDLVSERAYRYRPDSVSDLIRIPEAMAEAEHAAHDALVDTLADHDDALLEQVIEGAIPTPAELYAQLHKDLAARHLAGVMLGAAEHANGVLRLWKSLRHDTPAAAETAARRGIAAEGPPLAQVIRTTFAGQAGRLSFTRIWRGRIADGASFDGVRIGGMQRFPGDEAEKIAEAEAGEVVGLGRLEGIATGAPLGSDGESLAFPPPPAPVHVLAIAPAERRDDVKLSGALQKLLEEDFSLVLTRDAETGETLLAGQGDIHLAHAIERLARNWGIAVTTARPRVHFKETIRKPVQQHARLKRQTGGHGQFADVKLDIAPRGRGEGFVFVDKIVGGAVPRQYIPAVGEAAEDATSKGPFGYKVVDVGVTLVDGGFHSVDSSDMAFRSATRAGMAEALASAEPVLLEPIHRVTVTAPNTYTAHVQRLLTGRRGQILGFAERPGMTGWDDTEALVPEAELFEMIIELRSQTAGLGTFAHAFDHLAEAPARLAEKIAREAAAG